MVREAHISSHTMQILFPQVTQRPRMQKSFMLPGSLG